jgi:hypothetical protein
MMYAEDGRDQKVCLQSPKKLVALMLEVSEEMLQATGFLRQRRPHLDTNREEAKAATYELFRTSSLICSTYSEHAFSRAERPHHIFLFRNLHILAVWSVVILEVMWPAGGDW